LLYAAGLFDGEGSINLSRKVNELGVLRTSLASTSPSLTSFMADNFGGAVYEVKTRGPRQASTEWVLQGRKAVAFVVEIAPYLREVRKTARAKLVAEVLVPLLDQPRSAEVRQSRVEFEENLLRI
jgi:hypothetical protein